MVLLLLLISFWGGPCPVRCLGKIGEFRFQGNFRLLAVATNNVYIATDEKLYQLSHDLSLVQSVTQRGILNDVRRMEGAEFRRQGDNWNTTFLVNVLLPFVKNGTLISCGVTSNECGYCEVLDIKAISNVIHSEHVLVGPPWYNSASVAFLVNVEKTETYILTAIQQHDKPPAASYPNGYDAVYLYNTNDNQTGRIFSSIGELSWLSIKREGNRNVEFVDGFQVDSIIYLFSNLPSRDKSNKIRLIWLEGKHGKAETLDSLRGATLSISDAGRSIRLLASSVVAGGPPRLWSGVFSVDGGETNTQLVLFDISPDLADLPDTDPDFCIYSCEYKQKKTPKTLWPKKVLFRQNYMTSVLVTRQKSWMVFFIGTRHGQLIQLAVDKNYNAACPKVLYRASDIRQVFPKLHLDHMDHKHVYVPFQNQIKRVPVSKCSTYTHVQDCWSAQDPYCVWCSSKRSCTFEADCQDSDWLSISEDSQKTMVSYKVEEDSTTQISLTVQTHLTVGQLAASNFACQFSTTSTELHIHSSPQFPECTCIIPKSKLPANGLYVTVQIRLGTTHLLEQMKILDCAEIRGPSTSYLCQQCIEAGCSWHNTSCSWPHPGQENQDNVCQMMVSRRNTPEIFSISPSVVSVHGRNGAVLSGNNLNSVTRVRIQAEGCTPQESPVWSNTGESLMFHIPSLHTEGMAQACVVLPDGSSHSSSNIIYRPSPSCTAVRPSSSWASGKRRITLMGSYLEFVEGIVHSHAPQDVRLPRNMNYENLTYDTPAAKYNGIFTSNILVKIANETLACSATVTYYPDPVFTRFTPIWTGDHVHILIEKKADKLDMNVAELSVWGVQEGQHYPCIIKAKETNIALNYFTCEIQGTSDTTFQQLVVTFGDKKVTLGPFGRPSLSLFHAVLRTVLPPCIIVGGVCLWRCIYSRMIK